MPPKISLVDPGKGRSTAPAHSYIHSLESEPALLVPELGGRVLTVNLPRCQLPTAGHCVPLFSVPRLRVSAVLRPILGSRWAPPGTHSVDAWGPHTQER